MNAKFSINRDLKESLSDHYKKIKSHIKILKPSFRVKIIQIAIVSFKLFNKN